MANVLDVPSVKAAIIDTQIAWMIDDINQNSDDMEKAVKESE